MLEVNKLPLGKTDNALVFSVVITVAVLCFILFGQYLIGSIDYLSVRALSLLVGVIFCIYAFSRKDFFVPKLPIYIISIISLWMSCVFLSSILSEKVWVSSFRGLEWVVSCFFCFSIFFLCYRKPNYFLGFICGANLFSCFIVFWFSYKAFFVGIESWTWEVDPFLNIRHAAYIPVLAFSCSHIFLSKQHYQPRVFLIFSLFSLSFLVWSGGRAAVLSALISSLIFFSYSTYIKRSRSSTPYILLAWVAGFSIGKYLSIDELILERWGDNVNAIASNRIYIWESAINLVKDNILWGVGGDVYSFMPLRADETVHPHNFLVQLLGEWGIVGLLSFSLLCFIGFFQVLKRVSEVNIIISSTLVSFFTLALVDGNLFHSFSILLFAAFVGGAMGVSWDKHVVTFKGRLLLPFIFSFLLFLIIQINNIATVTRFPSVMPTSLRAHLFLSIPTYSMHVEKWLPSWYEYNPEDGYFLLQWLQQNSRNGWYFYLHEAQALQEAGFVEEANMLYQKALAMAPVRTRDKIEAFLIE